MDGAVKGEEVTMAMVADMHHASAGGAAAIEDVKLPEGEVGIVRPMVRHGAELRVVPDSRGVVLQAGKEDTREPRWFLAPCVAVEKKGRR